MSAMLEFDTGPLNWVRGDIEAALKGAADRIRACQADASLENALRLARNEAHQATGALRMVGLEGAAALCTAVEETLAAMDSHAVPREQAATSLLDAIDTLLKWVSRMAEGRGEGELALFPAYRQLRQLNGAERVFEGELFYPTLQVRPSPVAAPELPQAELTARVKTARAGFQRGLLAFLRGSQVDAGLAAMRKSLADIEAAVSSQAARTFWWACVGFIDALQNKGVEPDFHVKQLLARIDLQMRRLMDGSPQVAERLMRDALFFIAKSKTVGSEAQAVRAAFALEKYLPRQSAFDAEQILRARPLVAALRETLNESRQHWNAFADNHASALQEFQGSAARLIGQAETLGIQALTQLAQTLSEAASVMMQLDEATREAVRLEIATTLLFLQNATANEDLFEQDFPLRAQGQVRRIKAALAGHAEKGAEDLLDAGTRKASEHALLAQLGREISGSLQQLEDGLDAFFRDPNQRDGLSSLESLTTQIHGALSILELQDASELLDRAMAMIRPYLQAGTPTDEEKAGVADALSSLGLFVEAHCSGRVDAARILQPVRIAFGLAEADPADAGYLPTVEDGLDARKALVASTYVEWQTNGGDDSQKKCLAALTELGHDADLIADTALKAAVSDAVRRVGMGTPDAGLAAAIAQLTRHDIVFEPAAALDTPAALPTRDNALAPPAEDQAPAETDTGDLQATSATPEAADAGLAAADERVPFDVGTEPTAAAAQPQPEEAPAIDPELLAIFLEEADEVLRTLADAVAACWNDTADRDNLTVIRRAFHTLKGSGRMVGLRAFGDAAWGMEQLLNAWLAEERPASHDLLTVADEARSLFSDWVERLQADSHALVPADTLLARAARVARGESLLDTASAEASAASPTEADANVTVDILPAKLDDIVVAGVSLSPGLYQVFKDESTFWSAILREERTRLDEEDTYRISEPSRRGIHTLAGIAGTTGFSGLSELAHAIELYLKELEDRPLPRHARPVLREAFERVVGMIESIHANASPLPAEGLIRALAALQLEEYLPELPAESSASETARAVADLATPVTAHADAEAEVSPAGASATADAVDEAGSAPLSSATSGSEEAGTEAAMPGFTPAEATGAAVAPATEGAEADETDPDAGLSGTNDGSGMEAPAPSSECEGAAEAWPASSDAVGTSIDATAAVGAASQDTAPSSQTDATADTPIEELIAQAKRRTGAPVFEQRMVRDEIDAELLPVFLEEAEALIPQAAQALRQWKAQPAIAEFPAELRRVLHTIKGSARMAGAMRLGELTHIMESRVISVLEGELAVDAGVFETLENQYDRMANDVDRLRAGLLAPEVSQIETEAAEVNVVLPPEAMPGEEARPLPQPGVPTTAVATAESTVLRVRSEWLDRMVNEAGEVAIARSRIETEMHSLKRQVGELSEALRRLKDHLREVEIQAEAQMQATFHSHGSRGDFDPLEFDRFTRFQEVTRFMAESVHDISTIQQNLAVQLGQADAALVQQARMNRELQQNLLRVRMVPLSSVSERLYRVVRQAGRDLNKRAQLDIRNGELELDRGVLEKVVAPLEHLLRNAVAHGLEPPEVRRAAGKPEFGDIRIDARQEGNEMVLTVRDDGAGLNLQRIREKALAQGLLSQGMDPSDAQLAQLIFVPGFSTASEVTEISGRGVGMDVVKSEITSLGGRIEIATEAGKGVTFSIYLPLTLAVTQAVIVMANRQEYALPATMVEQVQELKPDHLAAAMQAQAIEWRGNRYPLFYLPHLLGQTDAVHEVQRFNTVVLMRSGSFHAALLVDVVEGAREIVVKNIGPQLARLTGIAGATVRGDGGVMLILNPVPLAARALETPLDTASAAAGRAEAAHETTQAPLVMVVDDSLTVRKISSRLMTREGYRVDTAKDGVEALEKMQDLVPDAVLLDVEMPRMDGFELARVMRNDPHLKGVPIIMITSRTADKHRNHALDLGVNVYLGKPYQEAVLLEHLHALLADKVAIAY